MVITHFETTVYKIFILTSFILLLYRCHRWSRFVENVPEYYEEDEDDVHHKSYPQAKSFMKALLIVSKNKEAYCKAYGDAHEMCYK